MLYLGGLMAGRGLEQLVDAIALVPEAQLVLLGDGVEEGRLLERAAAGGATVLVLPPAPADLVVAYASSAAVGVSPIVPSCLNYRYSLPNKLFQYMAAGIPVVASDFRQVRDVVEGAGSGVVVDTTRPDAIARALRRILADPFEAATMGALGRAAVEERFNWEASAAILRDVYEATCGRPRGRMSDHAKFPRCPQRPRFTMGRPNPLRLVRCADTAAPRFRSSLPSSSSPSWPAQPQHGP